VVVALAWIFDVKDGRIQRASAGAVRGLRLVALAAGIGIAAAAPGVIYFFLLRGPPTSAVPPASVAVLPFVNMSSDKDTDYFSDGITEELIHVLANVEGLRVASRTAVFAIRGKNLGVQQIGEELHVGTLLEGSIRREGNSLRVIAQLVNVSDGYHLWSKSYDRELKSIFAVEDDVARSIAESLQRTLVAVKAPTANLAAHDVYLRGRYFWNQRTLEAARKASTYFEEAIRLDPHYAVAHAGLADALAFLNSYEDAPKTVETLAPARRAALRALELDPRLAEAHASLGLIAYWLHQWSEALAEYNKAIELNANYAMAHKWRGNVLMVTGHLSEARVAFERAREIDPTSLIISHNLGYLAIDERNYGGAVEQLNRTLAMDPGFEVARDSLASAYALQGRYAEALAEAEKVRLPPESIGECLRAKILAMAGRREEALASARRLDALSAREPLDAALHAAVWAALGDNDRAFVILQAACASHLIDVDDDLKMSPDYDRLRPDPRFRQILRCVDLE
jgi:adenylate cyclase